jgi:hypothetical protein
MTLNYVAQVPYYWHNYYVPYGELPSMSSVVLLGITLLWFIVGYVGTVRRSKPGYFILVSFLCVEALFYLHTIAFGAFLFQLQNSSLLIKAIFVIGYISGGVAGYYAYKLIRDRKNFGIGQN